MDYGLFESISQEKQNKLYLNCSRDILKIKMHGIQYGINFVH